MILRAIEKGVSEDRIAAVLDVDVARIRMKRDMLFFIKKLESLRAFFIFNMRNISRLPRFAAIYSLCRT